MIASMNWVDIAILIVVGFFGIMGILKGFVKSAISLITWVAALLISNAFYPHVAANFPNTNPTVANTLSFVVISAIVLILGLIVGMILNRIVFLSVTLTALNTIGGGVFGLLKGAVVVTVVTYILMLTPAENYAAWHASRFAPYFKGWAQKVNGFVPKNLSTQAKQIGHGNFQSINVDGYKQKIQNMVK